MRWRCGGAAVALLTTQCILLCYLCLPKATSFIQQADDAPLTTLFQFFRRTYTDVRLAKKEYVNM
jgi:hypothetical protein